MAKRSPKFLNSVLIGILVVLPVLVLWLFSAYGQLASDWFALLDYQPPPEISKIQQNIKLTNYGQRLFFVHNPQLVGRDQFSTVCPVQEFAIVLGCYHSGGSIYIFDIDTMPELEGLEEVSAAHEMLHAGYDRLRSNKKAEINQLTKQVYDNLPDDSPIRKNIENYRVQGADVANELHSIIGTEVRDIPPELEEYYAQYFEDRGQIVSFSEKYSQILTDLRQKIEDYDRQLKELNLQIQDLERKINQQSAKLSRLYNELQLLREQPHQYNILVKFYNSQAREYNQNIQTYRQKVDFYNKIVSQRNEVSVHQQALMDAIDAQAVQVQE